VGFSGLHKLKDKCPTTWYWRWGFFAPTCSWALLLTGLAWTLLTGCAGSSQEDCLDPGGTRFWAQEDSLGLEEFLALEPEHRQARRDLAETWLERADDTGKAQDKVQALSNAAGLAPDDPEIWLQLARIWRWVGENLKTEACLDNAAAAVRNLGVKGADLADRSRGYKQEVALRTGLLRAWLHYDRAEYHEGLRWSSAVMKLEPGNMLAWQIQGVIVASLGYRSQAHEIAGDFERARGFQTNTAWILSNLDRSWGRHREAFNYFLNLRPYEEHAAECYRDMGLAAERVAEWSYARRWYRESAAALPFKDKSCLVEITHDRLDSRASSSHQPMWLAFGRYYVTGSRSAYTAYALERFDRAETPTERDTWAGLLVNSAGICLRLNEDKPWALRARGIVFSRTGKEDRGLEDLQRASKELAKHGIQDARVEAEIGHLLLVKQEENQAIRKLRKAVELEGEHAAAWRDLGLALILAGDEPGAEKALTRSLELDPTSVTAWYNRGLLKMHAGDFEQAESDLRRAAELAPDNQDVARLLQQVVQMRKSGE
jgi:tetratricopeptide (TPR) repeat protein